LYEERITQDWAPDVGDLTSDSWRCSQYTFARVWIDRIWDTKHVQIVMSGFWDTIYLHG